MNNDINDDSNDFVLTKNDIRVILVNNFIHDLAVISCAIMIALGLVSEVYVNMHSQIENLIKFIMR